MTENYYCNFNYFQVLINNLKHAQRTNDTERFKSLTEQINTFRKQCGTPITDEHLTKILNTTDLEDFELKFLRNAPATILRDLERGDTKNAEMVYRAVSDYIKPKRKFTVRGDQIFEVTPDGSLKVPEPIPTPKIRRNLTDSQIMLINKQKKEEEEK